jgi:hypothetical protein
VRKTALFFFILIAAALTAGYLLFSEEIKSYTFSMLQKFSPSTLSMEKIAFIEDDFALEDYLTLLDKIKTIENCAVLFLPQVFNTRTGDYLENIDPDDIRKMKEEYRNFILKLSDDQDVIPVVFLGRSLKPAPPLDISSFSYYKDSPEMKYLDEYNFTKAASKKIWYEIPGAGFYEDYGYYPYRIPAVFKYNGNVFVSAAVEGIRRYYRFPRTRVKFEDGRLKIGDIIDMPLQKDGEIIIRRLKDAPKIYSFREFLAAPQGTFNDRIIIVKSMMSTRSCMVSLGAAVACIMQGKYVKYSPLMNYSCALIIGLLLFVLYRQLKFLSGTAVFLSTSALMFFASAWLLSMDIYADTPVFIALNLLAFIPVNYFRHAIRSYDTQKRTGVFSRYMHPKSVTKFVRRNADIKIKNAWLKAYVMYIVFDVDGAPDAGKFKINFEKTREIIYNKCREFIIKNHDNSDIAVIIPDEGIGPETVISAALDLREKLVDLRFNIVLNYSEVYIFEVNGALWVLDRKYSAKEAASSVEKKRNIIISEVDIQKYINIIKFQKLPAASGAVLFNVAGLREGLDDEN